MICASVASKSRATELSEVVSRVISSGNFGAKSQLTVTINDSIGTLHLSSGEEEVFAVVAAADFSRRDCFNLLAEVAETFTTVSSTDRLRSCDRAGELNKTCQGFMKEVRTCCTSLSKRFSSIFDRDSASQLKSLARHSIVV